MFLWFTHGKKLSLGYVKKPNYSHTNRRKLTVLTKTTIYDQVLKTIRIIFFKKKINKD